jgi:putative methionine-R-sulfoxide reductase with GAF domain
MTDWKRLIDKEVVIQTENSKYFGKLVEVTDSGDGIIWIGFYRRDNGKFVLLKTTEIKKIEEIG